MQNIERRVLIVDSDTAAREEIFNVLKEEEYFLEMSECFTDAIQKISHTKFDCIIMDVNLPELKGYEAVPILKNIDPSIKVIMTTAKNTKYLESKVREQDIFYYYIKSFDKEELKLAVNGVFKKIDKEKEVKKMNKPVKVLVIDDDLDFVSAITTILESRAYEVIPAFNPKEGMEKLVSEKPDIILLDIMMDSLFDGFSMCHAIKTSKEYKEYRNTPIIFVSAVKEKTGSRFAFKGDEEGVLGPDDYIDKPVQANDLFARIERLIKK